MSGRGTIPREVACIGLDLAWSDRRETGLALLHLDRKTKRVKLRETCCLQTDEEILLWIGKRQRPTTVIAIDAPIIAPNPAGTSRPCDRALTRAFGRYHAGTYPAHREKCRRPIRFRRKLQRLGYNPDPVRAPGRRGRWQLEVYPHPAQIVLFNLRRILKYKKGKVNARRVGLRQLATRIKRTLRLRVPTLFPSERLNQLCVVEGSLRGRPLKRKEDQLDAVVCAYVGAYYWFWGPARCRVWGDVGRGYIVCPRVGV
ncbi:MAG: DUF429 domain-containing protein [Terriglobia bacterium]